MPNLKPYSFVIMKLTEGRTYIDPKVDRFIRDCENNFKLKGFYHYARPENNSAAAEAAHFVSELEKRGQVGEAVLALDWEGTAWNYPVSWAIDWLDEVYHLTKVKPVFYTSLSYLRRYSAIGNLDYGLWVAKWQKTAPTKTEIVPWKFWAFWQYSADIIDKDYFNGTPEQFMKYAKGERK